MIPDTSQKLKIADVERLFTELSEIQAWTNPTPDPTVWPPHGWQIHPTIPHHYFRVLSENDLREDLFGSPAKEAWVRAGKSRIEEIKSFLASYFFPKQKQEGTERKTKSGFVVMLKTGLSRKFDIAALAPVVAECQRIAKDDLKIDLNVEELAIKWQPSLDLTAYHQLPPAIQTAFNNALVVTPEKPKFEIVRDEA